MVPPPPPLWLTLAQFWGLSARQRLSDSIGEISAAKELHLFSQ